MQVLRERAGLIFTESRRAEVARAVERRLRRTRLATPEQYLRRLRGDDAEMDALVAACTVGETYFFREPGQLAFIRREVLPDIARRRPQGCVRAWSAGCASGEEAYTLAILLRESGLGARAQILGTDVSRHRLDRARRGRYSRWSLRGVPEAMERRYFAVRGEKYDLDPGIRAAVDFRDLNLVSDDFPSTASGVWGMDLILCRNVLIYMDRDLVERVARKLLDVLAPGGWLFLGASDPPLQALVECESVLTGSGVAYRPKAAGGARPRVEPVRTAAGASAPTRSARTGPDASPPPLAPPPPAPRGSGPPESASPVAEPAPVSTGGLRQADALGRVATVRRLADAGRMAEAGAACASGLEASPDCAELHYLRSALLTHEGRHAEAARAARAALYLEPVLAMAYLALGGALARLGDADAAGRAFRSGERLLASLPPDELVPASGGERAGRLVGLARAELRLLGRVAV